MQREGTLGFRLNHEHQDWATNEDAYDFGMYTQGTVIMEAIKHSDKTIEIKLKGPFPNDIIFREPIPQSNPLPVLHVSVTWKDVDVKLFLNGKLVASKAP